MKSGRDAIVKILVPRRYYEIALAATVVSSGIEPFEPVADSCAEPDVVESIDTFAPALLHAQEAGALQDAQVAGGGWP